MSYNKKDPKLISGTQIANKIKENVREDVARLQKNIGRAPKLATVCDDKGN
jgi:5,10-methylene-tetrahydrofolate dehydrogenase/methenyl tetrahydrofolate cyclohydrolase